MKIALIVLGVFLFLTVIAALIGLGVKRQEEKIVEQMKDAQDRVSANKVAYKRTKKRNYGKAPSIK